MEREEIKKILEALLFITDQPVTLDKLNEVFDGNVPRKTYTELLEELKNEYTDRNAPMELREVAEGFQFATKPEFSQWVRKLFKDRVMLRLSPSALETLAIVAYKQPLTRAEVEEIRGVETVAVLDRLLERKLVRIVGRKETVGRPLLYGTTNEFLKYFGLVSLTDLPSLEELTLPESAAGSQQEELEQPQGEAEPPASENQEDNTTQNE